MLKAPESKDTLMDYKTDFNNIDALLSELNKPKQDFQTPENPDQKAYDSVFGDLDSQESERENQDPQARIIAARQTAKFFDRSLSFGAQMIAKTDSRDKYKATPEDIEELTDAWASYMELNNINIPPWAILLVVYVTTYMPKFTQAFNDKRFKEMNSRLQKIESQLVPQ